MCGLPQAEAHMGEVAISNGVSYRVFVDPQKQGCFFDGQVFVLKQ